MFANVVGENYTVLKTSLNQIVDGQALTMKSLVQLNDYLIRTEGELKSNVQTVVPTLDMSLLVNASPKKIQGTALTRFQWILCQTKVHNFQLERVIDDLA